MDYSENGDKNSSGECCGKLMCASTPRHFLLHTFAHIRTMDIELCFSPPFLGASVCTSEQTCAYYATATANPEVHLLTSP